MNSNITNFFQVRVQKFLFFEFGQNYRVLRVRIPAQMVAQSLLPSSHRILCASETSNTVSLPPIQRPRGGCSQSRFSCPILPQMGISTMIRFCAPCCICVIPRILTAIYPQLKLSLATLCETLFRLLIGSPLFLIALFVVLVLGAKHSELKKMPFEALDFDQYNVKSGRITIGNRRLFRLMPDVAESQQISLPPTVPPDMKRSRNTHPPRSPMLVMKLHLRP